VKKIDRRNDGRRNGGRRDGCIDNDRDGRCDFGLSRDGRADRVQFYQAGRLVRVASGKLPSGKKNGTGVAKATPVLLPTLSYMMTPCD